jgi:hypothetical protein
LTEAGLLMEAATVRERSAKCIFPQPVSGLREVLANSAERSAGDRARGKYEARSKRATPLCWPRLRPAV